jgi:hypothetical protein
VVAECVKEDKLTTEQAKTAILFSVVHNSFRVYNNGEFRRFKTQSYDFSLCIIKLQR